MLFSSCRELTYDLFLPRLFIKSELCSTAQSTLPRGPSALPWQGSDTSDARPIGYYRRRGELCLLIAQPLISSWWNQNNWGQTTSQTYQFLFSWPLLIWDSRKNDGLIHDNLSITLVEIPETEINPRQERVHEFLTKYAHTSAHKYTLFQNSAILLKILETVAKVFWLKPFWL